MGTSETAGSPHRTDNTAMWHTGEYRRLLWDMDEILAGNLFLGVSVFFVVVKKCSTSSSAPAMLLCDVKRILITVECMWHDGGM